MTIKEYQEYVRNGASDKYTKELALIGLVGEVGEVADIVKKEAIYEDMSKFIEKYGMSVEDKIIDETGGFVFIIIDGIKNSINLREQTNIESICWILDNPTHYHNCEYLTIYTEAK